MLIWKLDITQVHGFSEEMRLRCLQCPRSYPGVEKWDDENCTYMYEMECADCKVRCLSSNDVRPRTWTGFSCGTKGGFRRPEKFQLKLYGDYGDGNELHQAPKRVMERKVCFSAGFLFAKGGWKVFDQYIPDL